MPSVIPDKEGAATRRSGIRASAALKARPLMSLAEKTKAGAYWIPALDPPNRDDKHRIGKVPLGLCGPQQMRGSCSPESQSTTREPPKPVFMTTMQSASSTISPIFAAFFPSG